jgi:hypothetical protein
MTSRLVRRRTNGQHRALWPLPGSAADYSDTLPELLRIAEDNPSVSVFLRRLQKRFPRVSSTASGYLKSLINVGLVEREGARIQLTAAGRQLLRGDRRVLSEVLIERIAGVAELMRLLSEDPMRIGQLHERLQSLGFTWHTQSQVRYRLRWMEGAGLVERMALSRYPQYTLTTFGRRVLRRRAGSA